MACKEPFRRLLAVISLIATLLMVLGVAPAQANVYRSFTTFAWSGARCITAQSSLVGNAAALGWATVCDDEAFAFHQINETVVQSGQWVGVKIPLTGQGHVDCQAWLGPANGLMSVYARDSADSSLGSGEADCLRQVP